MFTGCLLPHFWGVDWHPFLVKITVSCVPSGHATGSVYQVLYGTFYYYYYYHNIVRSDEKRTIQKILKVQEKEARKTTWLNSVIVEIEKYNITLDPKESLKSTWKKEIKRKITEKEEKEIREKCKNSTKSRIVKEDKYEKKEYLLGKVSLAEVKKIMAVRMNMSKIPGNFKGKDGAMCPLCLKGEGQTEHYFECRMVHRLKKVWDVNQNDLTSLEVEKMKDVANFMGKVEVMIEPKQSRTWQCGLGTKRTVKGKVRGTISRNQLKKDSQCGESLVVKGDEKDEVDNDELMMMMNMNME